MSNDLDLAVTGLGDDDLVAEVADTALDLDAVMEELLEGGNIEDLITSRLGGVDDELGHVRLVVLRPLKKMNTYLLGDLLGLATTSLLPRN